MTEPVPIVGWNPENLGRPHRLTDPEGRQRGDGHSRADFRG
ncbi:MAG: hypothetical protein ACNYNX_11575 [Leucobacter sp.]